MLQKEKNNNYTPIRKTKYNQTKKTTTTRNQQFTVLYGAFNYFSRIFISLLKANKHREKDICIYIWTKSLNPSNFNLEFQYLKTPHE